MKNQKAVKNLVTMVQTGRKAKTFRNDYPVSEKLRIEMVDEVFQDFMINALNEYNDDENVSILEEFVKDHCTKEEKAQSILKNLFCLQLLYNPGQEKFKSCIENYISENITSFKSRSFITSWLRECDKSVPKFYYIGHKFNDHSFIAIDILEEKLLEVIACDSTSVPPKQGEIAAGTLLPLGGGLYFPMVDFYHFDYESREAIASCFHNHYEKHLKNSNMHEAFLHVLSIMLQIESIISLEKQDSPKGRPSNDKRIP